MMLQQQVLGHVLRYHVPGDPYCGLLDKTHVHQSHLYSTCYHQRLWILSATISYNSLVNGKIDMLVNNQTTAPNKTFGSYNGHGLYDQSVGAYPG